MSVLIETFLLTFSGLFSIVNPFGAALIFSQVTPGRTHAERADLARRIAVYSAIIMLVALWGGAYVLGFFGITVSALRVAGGLVVAASAWSLLFHTERHEETKQQQATTAEGDDAIAFFPLTMPFTAGPGTIAVAIAIGSNMHSGSGSVWPFVLGASAAAIAVAVTVWLTYTSADRIVAFLGETGARVVSRLSAFLLLCIGTQIAMSGVRDYLHGIGP
jgi:multiple antibiotic resistance protein